MNIFLVRHGECSTYKRYTGSGSNVPLNSEGLKQIKDLSEQFTNIIKCNNTVLYCSNLVRGIESAKIFSEQHNIPLEKDIRLNEINFGDWEGLTYNEIMLTNSELATKWYNNPESVTPPNAEPYCLFKNRVKSFYNYLLQQKNDSIIVVTHGGVIQLLSTLILKTPEENRWDYNIPRGGYVVHKLK